MTLSNAAIQRILVIPARRRSTRLPDKMLLRAGGKSVIQHTYEAALKVRNAQLVLIATDDEEIAAEARRFGALAVMTSPDCPSGTDRVAEAVAAYPAAEVIVNLQGDEPDADAAAIDRLFELLENNPAAAMATLATPIRERHKLEDPSCVKVTFDNAGRAMYFSRSPIPHAREWDDRLLTAEPLAFHQHIGIYGYRRSLLMQMPKWPVGQLEQIEKLEQLRVLENGESILVAVTQQATRGIDTPEDFAAFVARRAA